MRELIKPSALLIAISIGQGSIVQLVDLLTPGVNSTILDESSYVLHFTLPSINEDLKL